MQAIFETVEKSIDSAPRFDSSSLLEIQDLLTSCLRSRRKSILNRSILTWNRTFGAASSLKYPEALLKVLFKLKDVADIQLPGIENIQDPEVSSVYCKTFMQIIR